mgnify:CR=1 FL=1
MYDDSNLKWGNNKNQRYNFRLSNTFHLTKNFDLESIIFYYRQDQVSPTQIGEALTAGTQQPGFPSSTMDGKPYAWGNWATPNWRCELEETTNSTLPVSISVRHLNIVLTSILMQ